MPLKGKPSLKDIVTPRETEVPEQPDERDTAVDQLLDDLSNTYFSQTIETVRLALRRSHEEKDRVRELEHQNELRRLEVEKRTTEIENLRSEVRRQDADTDRRKSSTAMRESFSKWSFVFLVSWSIAMLLLVIAHGVPAIPFQLSDTVLSILVGSTTASVIGLVGFVIRGLFRR